MIRLVHELAAEGFPVAVTCRVLQVAPSTYYEAIKREPSAREVEDRDLTGLIVEVHDDSRGTYGAPRTHAELRMGLVFGSAANAWHASCEGPVFTVSRIAVSAGNTPTRQPTTIS